MNGVDAEILDMDDWETEMRKPPSLRLRLVWLWRDWVHNPWYWLKCRLWHRYNVVRIKTLPPTWCDRDDVLLHAAFQILTDFVEKERPFEWFDTKHSDHKKEWQTIRELYAWWTVARPARVDLLDTIKGRPTGEQYDQCWKQEDAWRAEDRKMLMRLVNVRGHLWT